jgi:hypothetical protein
MEERLYDNPQEFQRDADEILAVLFSKGAKDATPLVEKFKEKYAGSKKRSPESLQEMYVAGKIKKDKIPRPL